MTCTAAPVAKEPECDGSEGAGGNIDYAGDEVKLLSADTPCSRACHKQKTVTSA